MRSGVKLPYMNKLFQSIKKGVVGTFNFNGNSNQFEYCVHLIFLIIFFIFTPLPIFYILNSLGVNTSEGYGIFYWQIFLIILFISLLASISGRLKNLKMNKGLLILPFIPIVGLLFVIYLCLDLAKKNKKKPQKY